MLMLKVVLLYWTVELPVQDIPKLLNTVSMSLEEQIQIIISIAC